MKKYTIEIIEEDHGPLTMRRENDGFTAFELLGFIELAKQEVIEMIEGKRKPDEVIRNVVVDKKKTLTREWMWDECISLSVRLFNGLNKVLKGRDPHVKAEDFMYLEDIKISQLRKVRDIGDKSVKEFIELRGY